jgi:hypothetical protein
LLVTAVGVSVALLVGFSGAAEGRSVALATAKGCAGPVTHDPYQGFRIGVPAGWNLFTLAGSIVVSESASGTEEAVVEPALLTRGLTPTRFFFAAIRLLQREIAAGGNSLAFHVTGTNGALPVATLAGRAGHVRVAGEARVFLLPDRTAHGSQLVVFSAFWAPPSRLNADRPQLAAIGLCYAPQAGTLYRVVKDQVFTYAIPLGWKVSSEGQDTITVGLGTNASATYLLTLVPTSTGVTSARTLLQSVFGKLGIRITGVLSSITLPNRQTSSGAIQEQEYIEFTGVLKGTRPLHGIVHVLSVTGGGFTSGVIRLGLATPSLWNSVNGALTQIIGSIQHDFTQDLQQWERVNRDWQRFGQQVQGFDYALNGVDLVRDPATGQTFEAPYNTYDPGGPDGPGYYSGPPGNRQKLRIITP